MGVPVEGSDRATTRGIKLGRVALRHGLDEPPTDLRLAGVVALERHDDAFPEPMQQRQVA